MNKKFTCPYCYAEHDINDCGLKCSYNIIGKTGKCKHGGFKDNNGWIKPQSKTMCLNCEKAIKQLFCCDAIEREIPRELLSGSSLPIALLGAKASGKSNYIGVLINEIKTKMTGPFNCSLSMACEESQKAYDELYYRPLYERGVTVKATDRGAVPPLIFPLRFNENNHVCVLTFYDTAGEDLDDQNGMHMISSYITNAKGIIVLLDPLQIKNIRDKLSNNGFTALPAQNKEIDNVLRTIVYMIRNVKNVKGQIQIPLALVITKIDVLEHYNLLPEKNCLRMESGHIELGTFVRSEFENTNIEMKDLIENWIDGEELLGYINQFKRYSFFGVTSLGGNPTNGGTKIGSQGIHPRRVLDPFLWLLDENGYFNDGIKKIQNKFIGGLGEITRLVKKYI
jgi:GTPase SAR1 family protein